MQRGICEPAVHARQLCLDVLSKSTERMEQAPELVIFCWPAHKSGSDASACKTACRSDMPHVASQLRTNCCRPEMSHVEQQLPSRAREVSSCSRVVQRQQSIQHTFATAICMSGLGAGACSQRHTSVVRLSVAVPAGSKPIVGILAFCQHLVHVSLLLVRDAAR